ncbi:hypothetical protein ANN_25218 [Periplaneta americana]|uniref:Mos1 transposase HTH domain-containing protein n=1 Tax=Periplaneta americana TaxID=6978 RepID=A0ABQ8S101_PERAM|nr:hypothetical protein ANN_25218 [Periplaneta americana]
MGESRNAYRVLVGRPRRRWEDNIKLDLREVEYDGKDWINLAQNRDRWRAYVRAAMNLQVPVSNSGRQHSLKCAMGTWCRPARTVMQQGEIESIPASSYESTIVQCVFRGRGEKLDPWKPTSRLYRAVIEFIVKDEKSAAEIHLRLQRAYGDVCMGASSVRRWVKHFEDGNTSIQDEPRSGRPRTASTERNKERVEYF